MNPKPGPTSEAPQKEETYTPISASILGDQPFRRNLSGDKPCPQGAQVIVFPFGVAQLQDVVGRGAQLEGHPLLLDDLKGPFRIKFVHQDNSGLEKNGLYQDGAAAIGVAHGEEANEYVIRCGVDAQVSRPIPP